MSQSQSVTGHFDGHSIVPDQPLRYEPGQRLRISIVPLDSPNTSVNDEYPLSQIAEIAVDMGIEDLAELHTQYARSQSKAQTDAPVSFSQWKREEINRRIAAQKTKPGKLLTWEQVLDRLRMTND